MTGAKNSLGRGRGKVVGESSKSGGKNLELIKNLELLKISGIDKEILDPTTLPSYEFVIGDYTDVGEMEREYMKLFDWLIAQCSEGGGTLWDLPLSNPGASPAYCLLTVDVPIFEIKKTDIIIHRSSVYVHSMTIDEKWMVTTDCPFRILGETKLPFSSSYMDLPGRLTTIGIGRLANALRDWNNPIVMKEKHGEAFRNVVYNIPEICRFKVLKNAILKKLHESHSIHVSVEVEHKYRTLFTNWHMVTEALDKFRVLVGTDQRDTSLEAANKALEGLWNNPSLELKTGFSSLNETIESMGLLMCRKVPRKD